MAQEAEHFLGKEEVAGSSPAMSSTGLYMDLYYYAEFELDKDTYHNGGKDG